MERLLQSSSCHVPLSYHFKYSPLLPGRSRIDSRSLEFSRSRRVNSISCKGLQNSYGDPSCLSVPCSESSFTATLRSDLVNEAKPSPNFLERICAVVDQRKVTAWRTLILVASITGILFNPIFPLPAFAGVHTATETTGPAAASFGSKLIQTELVRSVWAGLFASCLHALSGPDHLAALAPLSIGRTRMESAEVGALWGCGHGSGQVIFCLILSLLSDRLQFEVIRTWCIRLVGYTLLVIGALGIKQASEVAVVTTETDMSTLQAEIIENSKEKIRFAAFATGVVHGFQPDWLMLVWPVLTFPSFLTGAAFLVTFMVGTVVAMGSYTAFIGFCSQALEDKVPRITEKLTWASSLVAIGLGLAILITKIYDFPWRSMFCLRQIIDVCFSQKLWLIRRFI